MIVKIALLSLSVVELSVFFCLLRELSVLVKTVSFRKRSMHVIKIIEKL